MTKVQTKNNIYYYEFSNKSNFDIIGITLSMWKQHNFKTIFTSDNVLNIKYFIVKGLGYRERELSMGLNSYFVPIRTNISHATPIYGPSK